MVSTHTALISLSSFSLLTEEQQQKSVSFTFISMTESLSCHCSFGQSVFWERYHMLFYECVKKKQPWKYTDIYCRGFHLDKVRQGPHECLCFYRRVLSFRDTLTQGIHKEKRKWSRWPKAVILCVKICVYAGIWKCRCNKSTDGK